jgi:putative nucleotidyltransferase with HDIG domain
MAQHLPNREDAWKILNEHNSSDSLIKHALAVEGVMRHMAEKSGEDADLWGIIGLVHDLDYERFPDQHCIKTEELLKERGWPQEYVRAVVSHGWGLCSDVEPRSLLEKTLYAVDELVGFVTACALVRPSRSVMDLDARSVLKKWKQKSFAASVNREVIEKGAAMLGVDLNVLVQEVIAGMRKVAPQIGL